MQERMGMHVKHVDRSIAGKHSIHGMASAGL